MDKKIDVKVKDLLYKRMLVAKKNNDYSVKGKVEELKILEISPSENWIKVQNANGNKYWIHYSDIVPIEILAFVHNDKPKEK